MSGGKTITPNVSDHRFRPDDMVEFGSGGQYGPDRVGRVVREANQWRDDGWLIVPVSGLPGDGFLAVVYPTRQVGPFQPHRWEFNAARNTWQRTYAEVVPIDGSPSRYEVAQAHESAREVVDIRGVVYNVATKCVRPDCHYVCPGRQSHECPQCGLAEVTDLAARAMTVPCLITSADYATELQTWLDSLPAGSTPNVHRHECQASASRVVVHNHSHGNGNHTHDSQTGVWEWHAGTRWPPSETTARAALFADQTADEHADARDRLARGEIDESCADWYLSRHVAASQVYWVEVARDRTRH